METTIFLLSIFNLVIVASILFFVLKLFVFKRTLTLPIDNDRFIKELIKRYKSATTGYEKELWLQKILDVRMANEVTFRFYESLTKETITIYLKQRQYDLLRIAIENIERYSYRVAPNVNIDTLVKMIQSIQEMRLNVCQVVERDIKENEQDIKVNELVSASQLPINDSFNAFLVKLIKTHRHTEQESEINNMIEEINRLDLTSASGIRKLTDWNTKAIILSQKGIYEPAFIDALREAIDLRSVDSSSLSFKIPTQDELIGINRSLDNFATPIVLDREKYLIYEPLMRRAVEIIRNANVLMVIMRKRSESLDSFDLNTWTTRLNNYEQSKVLTYQKHALSLISKTHKTYDNEKFFLKGGATKLQLGRQLLQDTIWTLDESYLTPAIIKVMREVEDEVLSKVSTDSKIVLAEEQIKRKRSTLREIFE